MSLLISPTLFIKCNACNSVTDPDGKKLEYSADGEGGPLCPICGSSETDWPYIPGRDTFASGLRIAPYDGGSDDA